MRSNHCTAQRMRGVKKKSEGMKDCDSGRKKGFGGGIHSCQNLYNPLHLASLLKSRKGRKTFT